MGGVEETEVQTTETFVFTDVEGSTQLLRRVGDEYRALLQRHRVLLRAAFERHGGNEQGTEGDGFFVVFPTAAAAAQASVDAQLAMLDEPWPPTQELRVRIGLHSGPAAWVDDEVFGLAVHEAARIAATAHGGQIVASDVTRRLAEAIDGVGWEVLGDFELKDIEGATRLFQLAHPALPREFPPLRARSAFRHNLPRQADPFVGRREELDRIARELRENAVVSLAGPGGIGKSRLAVAVAELVLTDHADGVWLVALAPVTEPEAVPSAIGGPFGIRPGPAGRVTELLQARLGDLDTVVILDNCEHVLDACADVTSTLLATCPGLTVLTTTREPLGIAGELVVRVPPLTLPVGGSRRELEAADATALFLERATRAVPDLALTVEDLESILEICRRLDGLPLAIELAAARVNLLSPVQIESRLDDRFRLLTGGSRSADPRQQTLRATVEWSYGLLDEAEQTLLRQLAVFVDDFSVDAVEGIARSPAFATVDVLDLLGSLVAKSLVVPTVAVGERRHRLLETMRQFGAEQLAAAGEAAGVAERHADWYGAWALAEFERLQGGVLDAGIRVIERERPNLLAALRWALDEGDEQRAAAAGLPLSAVWLTRDYYDEGLEWIGRLVESLSPSPRLGAVHTYFSAMLLAHNADAAGGLEHARAALAMFERERVGPLAWLESLALHMEAIALSRTGRPDAALVSYDASIRVARAVGDAHALASCLCSRPDTRDVDVARANLAEATQIYRSLGSDAGLCRCGWHLAELEAHEGDPVLGVALAEEAVESGRRFGPSFDLVNALVALAQLRMTVGRMDDALDAAIEAFELAQRSGNSQVAQAIQDGVRFLLGGDPPGPS